MKLKKLFLIVFLITGNKFISGNGNNFLFYDSFKNLSSQWCIPSGKWEVKDGVLQYNGKSKEKRLDIRISTGNKNWNYYSAEVKLKRISPDNPVAFVGLAAAVKDNKNFLIFAIKKNGYFLGYSKDGKWTGKWKIKEGIDTSKLNTLRLNIYKQGIEAYLNNKFLDSMKDIPFCSGGIGFIFDSSVYCAQFDNVKVKKFSYSELKNKTDLSKQFSVSLISSHPTNLLEKGEKFFLTLKLTGKPKTEINYEYEITDTLRNKKAKNEDLIKFGNKNEIEKKIFLKTDKIGFYKVVFKIKNRTIEDVYAVIPSHDNNKPDSNSPFGIHTNLISDDYADFIKKLGAKWVRTDIVTIQVEPTKEKWNWSKADEWIKRAKERNMKLIVCLGYSYWMGEKVELDDEIRKTMPWGGRFGGGYPVRNIEEWKEYIREVVKRYHDYVKDWEIWNEVDLSFYSGTPDEYVSLLKAAYCEIKKIDPQARVYYGGSCMCPYFAEKVMENQGENYFDILAVHFYTPPPNIYTIFDRITYGHSLHLFKKFKFYKPIICTEGSVYSYDKKYGAAIDPTGRRVSDIIKVYTLLPRYDIKKFHWFAPWGISSIDRKSKKIRPMPAAVGFSVVSYILKNCKYSGVIEISPDIVACVYEKGEKPLIVIWNKKPDKKKIVNLNVYSNYVKITNRLYESKSVKTEDRKLKIEIGYDPLFIENGGREIFKEAKIPDDQKRFNEIIKEIKIKETKKVNLYEPNVWVSCSIKGSFRRFGRWPKKLLIGEPFRNRYYEIPVKIHNYKHESIKGTVSIKIPDKWNVIPGEQVFTVPSEKTSTVNFKITVPAGFPYFVDTSFTIEGTLSNGKKIFPYKTETEVRPAFDVYLKYKKEKNGIYKVDVKAINRDKKPVGGKILIELISGKVKPEYFSFEPVKHFGRIETSFNLFLPEGKTINGEYPIWIEVVSEGEIVGIETNGIKGVWKYRRGDDMKYKEIYYDDSSWETTIVPGHYIPENSPWFEGYVWYRKKTFIPEKWKGQDMLLYVEILKDAGEVYFNGKKVGACGGLGPDFWDGWGYPGKFVIPSNFIRFGKENIVAVRTYSKRGGTNINGQIKIIPLFQKRGKQ